MSKEFNITCNDVELALKIPATKIAAKEFIKKYLLSTHIGQWRKLPNGYEYCTTIGKYYKFIKQEG